MTLGEDVGRSLYIAAGYSPDDPPRRGALDVALRMYGEGCIYLQPRAMAEATVALIQGKRRIVLRRGLTPQRTHFVVAQMLARLALGPAVHTEDDERDIAAWLVAPPGPFRRTWHQVGKDIAAVASVFVITQTCAAIRVHEVEGAAAAIATPDRVHRRGPMFSWARDEEIRALAAQRAPRSVRKVVLRDEPGRVALLAKSA